MHNHDRVVSEAAGAIFCALKQSSGKALIVVPAIAI